MELFQLRYFAAAARLLNFSKAAEEVSVSQPSLSLQIANLEREVGAQLFVREGRRVRLTDAGATLAQHAQRILSQEREARRAVRAVVGLEAGQLSLWTLPTPGQNLLPPTLARFRKAFPALEIRLHEAVPARLIGEAVARGEADLGIVQQPCQVPGLARRDLLTEELAVVVPTAHPLTQSNAPPTLADLRDEVFVWVPDGQTGEHPIYAACVAAGFSPRIACVSGSAQGMQSLVAAGMGIALLPRLALHPPDGAVVVELAPPAPTRTLSVVWRGKEDTDTAGLSHAARAFLEMLTEDTQDDKYKETQNERR